jgi:hypothetical protein
VGRIGLEDEFQEIALSQDGLHPERFGGLDGLFRQA